MMKYSSLDKSYKGAYPFRLGTTSFIYPDHYVPNVKLLGPFLDEIELLFFESVPADALPSKTIITELTRLAEAYELTYNIHLPTDVSISAERPENQKQAVDTLRDVIDLALPLAPSAYTLHIPYSEKPEDKDTVKRWQDRVFRNLQKILARGIPPPLIALETLNYPFELLDDIIDDLSLSVCLDLGHLMARNDDIKTVFNAYADKTSIIHLHGFKEDRDHMALDQLSAEFVQSVLWILHRFKGTVSLEVFSFDDLKASLDFLDKVYKTSNTR
jgi:sugar phosphate isomerase/epimerase